MKKLFCVLLSLVLSLPLSSHSIQARVFDTCVTAEDETYSPEQIRAEAERVGETAYVNANGDLLIPKGTSISEDVECEDGAFYAWVTLGIITGAAIGASAVYYLIKRGTIPINSKSFVEQVLSGGNENFALVPTFSPNTKSAGLKFAIKY